MKVLIVGFGSMGCRHAQSLLNSDDPYEVLVFEPSSANLEQNLARIGAAKSDITPIDNLEDINNTIDVAIIATSSKPRFEIVKLLLEKGVRFFLLEKIVFQSIEQFETILGLLNQSGAKAYCNFVNRYFNSYNELKSVIQNGTGINMTVYGGAFGVGCNAVHYIDIFQYLTSDNEIDISGSVLEELPGGNRRGNIYKEFSGTLSVRNKSGRLQIISDNEFSGGLIVTIIIGEKRYVLNEVTGKMFSFEGDSCRTSPFLIEPTSKLTARILPEIVSGSCRLTQLQDTFAPHAALFNIINAHVYNRSDSGLCCPIT